MKDVAVKLILKMQQTISCNQYGKIYDTCVHISKTILSFNVFIIV